MTLQIWLLLGLTALGGLGSVARYLLSQWQGFLPWGILTANVVASMIFGLCLSAQATTQASPFLNYLMPLLATGFAGGLSTFSSWAAQTAGLVTARQGRAAMWNTVLNLVLPVAAVITGMNLSPILLK
jgi:CrcB protein